MYTSIPLSIVPRFGLSKEKDEAQSIRHFLELLICSPCGCCEVDPEFGFVFKNFRFENFNEDKGILSSSGDDMSQSVFYKHKIHGRSINSNTFAHDLKKSIERYEKRLQQVKVVMEYKQKERYIIITINGTIASSLAEPFSHQIKIHIW